MEFQKHLTFEEIQRYADDEDYSQPFLQWFERINAHFDNCVECRSKLEKYMIASAVVDDFDLQFVAELGVQYKTKGILERVKNAAKGIEEAVYRDLIKGIEQGIANCFSFSATRYPALGVVRGSADTVESNWIEWKDDMMYVHSKGSVDGYYVIDIEKKINKRILYETTIVQCDKEGNIVAGFEALDKDASYIVRIYKQVK